MSSDQSLPPSSSHTSSAQSHIKTPHFPRVNKSVFWPSVIILILLVALAIIFPQPLNTGISWLSSKVTNNLSWYYILITAGMVLFALVVAFSKYGELKLGKEDEEPEYSKSSWFAMLFAAGMGIGLVFYGAAEPLSHFANPRPGFHGTASERATDAMATTFLHWGLHAWSIYVIVGLAVAYTCFRRGRPMSIRWTLEPIFGSRIKGRIGDIIDVVAIVGTLLGIATSLGFGVSQVSSGLEFLTGFHATKTVLIILVLVISAIAGISVVSGIGRGIQWLSNTNLVLAAGLAILVLLIGPTIFLVSEFVTDIGAYLDNFIQRSFLTLPFQGLEGTQWLSSWTTYYWGWWIAWSPFVGIFIARISRGRTIREFIVGVVAVPVLVTMLWFAILGGNALYQQIFTGKSLIDADNNVDSNTVLFQTFSHMPAGAFLSGLAMIIVIIFFVTSSDSGSFVMSMLSSGGNPDPSMRVRVTWATMTGLVTAAMMSTADSSTALAALQSLAILVALPFSFVMIGMMRSTWMTMREDHRREERRNRKALQQLVVESVSQRVHEDLDTSMFAITPGKPLPSGDRTSQVMGEARRFFQRRRVRQPLSTHSVQSDYRGSHASATPPSREDAPPSKPFDED